MENEALAEGCDRLAIVRYRVRYEWTVRACQGLTLQHLKSEMESAEWALDFFKSFEVSGDALIRETTEPDDLEKRPNLLRLESPPTPERMKVKSLSSSAAAKRLLRF